MSIKKIGDHLYKIDAAVKKNGKQFRKLVREWQGTEQKAHLEYARLQKECKRESEKYWKDVDNPYPTFGKVIEAFVKVKKPSNPDRYNRLIKDCADYTTDPKELKTLLLGGIDDKGRQIKGYIDWLQKANCRRYNGYGIKGEVVEFNRKLSNETLTKTFRALKRVCVWAYEQEIFDYNPVREKRAWSVVARNRILTDEELRRVMNTMEQRCPQYLPIFLHSIRNPSRIGDLRRLTRTNLNMIDWTIKFNSSKGKVDVTQPIYPELREYFINLPPECPYLFYSLSEGQDKKVIYRPVGNFKKAWQAVKEKAGVANLRWHDLRHHSLTWLMGQEGIKTQHAMVIGGWETRTMIEVYHNIDHDRIAEEAIRHLSKNMGNIKTQIQGEQKGEQHA